MLKYVVTALFAASLAAPGWGQDALPVDSAISEAPAGDATEESGPAPADASEAAVIADCSARKFESSVELEKGGQRRHTRMKLCSTAQADDASWVRTLEDAKTKISAHPDISDDSKASISKQIDAEIAKVGKKTKQ